MCRIVNLLLGIALRLFILLRFIDAATAKSCDARSRGTRAVTLPEEHTLLSQSVMNASRSGRPHPYTCTYASP